tara:strand:- start:151 stop:489 length:339 start_codon:yes stop_codon:yes gene_type:complete
MSAARYNLVIDQGSDFAVDFTISEDGTVKNLAGFSARAQMRTTKNSDTLSGTLSCSVPDPASGTIRMSLPHATSTAMAAGRYYYDLEIYTASDAAVTRILYGEVNLTQEVTR